MAKPVRKYGQGAVTLAVFEKIGDDGTRREFYSLQKGRKVGDSWENESVLLTVEQLAVVQQIVKEALGEGASSFLHTSRTYRVSPEGADSAETENPIEPLLGEADMEFIVDYTERVPERARDLTAWMPGVHRRA